MGIPLAVPTNLQVMSQKSKGKRSQNGKKCLKWVGSIFYTIGKKTNNDIKYVPETWMKQMVYK